MASSSSLSRDLEGHNIQLVLQRYADRILILVTQGKVGNLIQATIPQAAPLLAPPAEDPSQPNAQPLPPPSPAIELTSLLGVAPSTHMQTLHLLYAAQIATILWTAEAQHEIDRRPVIVGIALPKIQQSEDVGLSPVDRSVFIGVMGMLREVLQS